MVVETYHPARNITVRIHDDACLYDPDAIQRILDELEQISNEIIARKLRDGMTIEEIYGNANR